MSLLEWRQPGPLGLGPFAQPLMLLWVAAALIPIAIHFWSRRRYAETSWAAMQFLWAAVRNHARRIRIEQFILLALRVLTLVLLAMALANPILSRIGFLDGPLAVRPQTHWLLLIDASYSMDCRDAQQTRFAAAQAWAEQLVRSRPEGVAFTLLLMADPPQPVIAEPAFAAADVIEEIRGARLSHGSASLPAALAEADRLLAAAQRRQPRLSQHRVCLVTDLGRNTWEAVAGADCRERLQRLAERAELLLTIVGQGGEQNAAITRLEMSESLLRSGQSAVCDVEVKSFASRDDPARVIQLFLNEQLVHEQPLAIAARGQASCSVPIRFEAAGEHALEARLADDSLALDNHRWLSVPVRETVRVLVVEGSAGAARYVALALEPQRGEAARIRVEVNSENALLELDLNEFDCIFLSNVGRFTGDEALVLSRYLASGGGLVFGLGDQVQADNYNLVLGGQGSSGRLLPARLGPRVAGEFTFDALQYRHPLVAPFRGQERAGLLTTVTRRYVQLVPADPAAGRVALAFTSGDPAVVEEQILRGRCLIVATALTPQAVDTSGAAPVAWSDFALWPSFPPVMQQLLIAATAGRNQHRNVLVGEPLMGYLPGVAGSEPLRITSPDQRQERVRLTSEGTFSRWSFDATDQSGIYAASIDVRDAPSRQLFAANLDTRESDLQPLDRALLPAQLQPFHDDQGEPATRAADPIQKDHFRFLLAGVLVLLLVESSLAWYFGNGA